MKKPKVIHVFYSGLGGHGNVVFPLLDTPFSDEFENVLVFYGIEETLPEYIRKTEELGITHYSIRKKPREYFGPFRLFKKILEDEKPEAILVHSSELIIPARKYARKNTSCKTWYVEHQDNKNKSRMLRFLSGYALKRTHGVICLSQPYANELTRLFKGNAPVHVIPNGINTNRFSPNEKRENDGLVLGMASRMVPGKDHKNLLKAFALVSAENPKMTLRLAGNGPEEIKIKEWIEEMNLTGKVILEGLLNEKEMVDFYRSIDIYVQATLAETLSTAILQAMSCGIPILTSDINNNKLLIKPEQTGWLYRNRDSSDMADKLRQIANNYHEALKVGETARKFVEENYADEQMYKKYKQLIS